MRGRRVYVIDDEVDVLRGTRALLGLWGLEVQGAATTAAAEQLCADHGAPDLMIADLRLGGAEHGAQLAERLRQHYGRFPVLIVSGETSAAALEAANRHSFPLLHKPVTAEAFQSAIALALAGTSHAAG
jgi:DNA-binding NtrC family response regulator